MSRHKSYHSVYITARHKSTGSDDISDPFEEPASRRLCQLLFVNLGLLLFALGGVMYLTHGWDPTAFLCTAGYVMCGLGLGLPVFIGQNEEEKLQSFTPTCKGMYTVVGTFLNAVGLGLGILGSLMYSPTVNKAIVNLHSENEFEWMRQFANVIWAVSFFMFPPGVGLFLLERMQTLRAYNAHVGKPPPSIFDKNLRLLFWSFVMLCICALGGVFFCFDEQPGWELTACVLFAVAGGIKVALLVVEVGEACSPKKTRDESGKSYAHTAELLGDA